MRLKEFVLNDKKLLDILENASAGATGAGSIAGVASPFNSIIKRMPTTPNLFGYVEQSTSTKKKKKTKSAR